MPRNSTRNFTEHFSGGSVVTHQAFIHDPDKFNATPLIGLTAQEAAAKTIYRLTVDESGAVLTYREHHSFTNARPEFVVGRIYPDAWREVSLDVLRYLWRRFERAGQDPKDLPDSLDGPAVFILERILGAEVSVLFMSLHGVVCPRMADQAARRWAGYKPEELQFLERKASADPGWYEALRISLTEYDVAA